MTKTYGLQGAHLIIMKSDYVIFSASVLIPYAIWLQKCYCNRHNTELSTSRDFSLMCCGSCLTVGYQCRKGEVGFGEESVYAPVNTGRSPHCDDAPLVSLMPG